MVTTVPSIINNIGKFAAPLLGHPRHNPKGRLEVGVLYRDSHAPCQA